jgi:hypothetical protein
MLANTLLEQAKRLFMIAKLASTSAKPTFPFARVRKGRWSRDVIP